MSKRDLIKATAMEEFLARGFAAASLEEIASASRVSRQTVYNHFADKEELFLEVVDDALHIQLQELRESTEIFPDPPVDVEAYIFELAERIASVFLSARADALRRLIQSEVPRLPRLRDLWQSHSKAPVWSTLIGNLGRLAHAGLLEMDDPVESAGQLVSLTTGAGWTMTPMGTFMPHNMDEDRFYAALRANVKLFLRAYQAQPSRRILPGARDCPGQPAADSPDRAVEGAG